MIMKNMKVNNYRDRLSLAYLLNLRYGYESIVSFRSSFNLPTYESDLNSLKYFIQDGYKSNRFKKRYDDALGLAQTIVNHSKDIS